MNTTCFLETKLTNDIRHLVIGQEAEGSHEPEDELECVSGRPHESQSEHQEQNV